MSAFLENSLSFEPRMVLVAGAGVIGRSLALSYAQNFPNSEICLYDNDRQLCRALRSAMQLQGVENINVLSDMNSFLRASRRAELFDQCVPIDKMGRVQRSVRGVLPQGCIVTNRGSAQTYAMQQILPHVEQGRVHFGAHMLVGREASPGEDVHCYPEMFAGQICVIEALPKNASALEREAHTKLVDINQRLGMDVKMLPAHIHDQLLGAFSHENTAALRVLVNATEGKATGLGATIMRASVGSEAMWMPVYRFNQQAMVRACDIQEEALGQFKQALLSSDRTQLAQLLREAHEFRMNWPDAGEPVESLLGTMGELNGQGHNEYVLAQKVLMPLLFGVSRTLGFRDVVGRLGAELERYGHHYTDLLNTSAKDSTLAAKYNPDMLASLMWEYRAGLLYELCNYENQYRIFSDQLSNVQCDPEAAKALGASIRNAAEVMNGGADILPRRASGGQGFAFLDCPTSAGIQEFPLLPHLD